MKKDIPIGNKSQPIRAYRIKEKLAAKLNVDSLENGFDSLQIRIWCSPANVDSLQLIVIKGINGSWSAEISDYKFLLNRNRDSFNSIYGITNKIYPSSGWQAFLKKLFDLEIMTLADMGEAARSSIVSGVGGVTVELSTKSSYRFYNYLDPFLFADNISGAKKMEQIMNLIESEFKIKWMLRKNN